MNCKVPSFIQIRSGPLHERRRHQPLHDLQLLCHLLLILFRHPSESELAIDQELLSV